MLSGKNPALIVKLRFFQILFYLYFLLSNLFMRETLTLNVTREASNTSPITVFCV